MNLELWESDSGTSPIVDFIVNQDKAIKRKIDRKLMRLTKVGFVELIQSGLLKSMQGHSNLFELAFRFNKRFIRFFLTADKNRTLHVLHAFMKKSNKTPKKELDIALQRKKIIQQRYL